MAQQPPAAAPPAADLPSFTYDASLAEFTVSGAQWLRDNDKTWYGTASGACVFDGRGRVLLVQRAAHDSMPNLWEVPGGAIDDDDESILHGAARELLEEAGLVAKHIVRVLHDGFGGRPGAVFSNRTGQRFYGKFTFEVEVDRDGDGDGTPEVRLDPEEHQDFLWLTEEEVTKEAFGERKVPLTGALMHNLLRVAFQARRGESGQEEQGEQAASEQ